MENKIKENSKNPSDNPPDESLKILMYIFLWTFLIVIAVAGTVFLVLNSDKTLDQQAEKEKMSQIAKNNDSYAQSVLDKMDKGSESSQFSFSNMKKEEAAHKKRPNANIEDGVMQKTHENFGAGGKKDKKKIASDVMPVSLYKNVMPWKMEVQTLSYFLFGAMAMLFIAALLFNSSNGKAVAVFLTFASIAASMVSVIFSIKIMTVYNQAALGGIWLIASGISIISCSFLSLCGIASFRDYSSGILSSLGRNMKMLLFAVSIAGFMVAGILKAASGEYADKNIDSQYCSSHQQHYGCK